jgi:ComF family protein
MKQLLNSLAHLFFPHICAGCGYDLPGTSNLICFRCMNKIPYTSFHLQSNNPVEKIFWGRVYIRHSMSLCYFTRQSLVQRLLHQLKYNGNKELGIYMGKLMGMALAESGRFADIDVLLPLPMHPEKEKRRGYNQARVLCEGIAGILQIPIAADLLVKQQSTATQTKKGRVERWQNVANAFLLKDTGPLENKHILLVDDVLTTGATLEAAALALKEVKGLNISIATFAYAWD